MIAAKVERALNTQMVEEIYSSYLYLSMSAYFQTAGLPGFASWMKIQAQEELAHAMKFFDFIVGRGGKVVLEAIAAPQKEWSSPLAAFEAAYKHECMISGLIGDLVELARHEKDHATEFFLHWFVTEQVEEEATADEIVKRLGMIGESKNALFQMDQELAKRSIPTGE